MHDVFHQLFVRHFGVEPTSIQPVAADASHRRMCRLLGPQGERAVAVHGPEPEENLAFLSFSRTFRELDLPVPELYVVDEEADAWLEEDLGDMTLFDAVVAGRRQHGGAFPPTLVPVYRRVLEILPRFQVEGGRAIDYDVAYPRATFDAQAMLWDLSYFKYHFLMLAHVPFHEDRLEQDFHRLTEFLLEADTSHFVYRDLQSRNVMVREQEPWFLDYQGGRRGALQYDVASILHDAKAALPEELREELLGLYLTSLEHHLPVDRDLFRRHYRANVLLRSLQALGTYGYRGFYERKPRFLKSIAPRVADVEQLLETGFVQVDLPELRAALERICATESFRPPARPAAAGLNVRVGSFAYRNGYPAHDGPHGGGFVFDCRAQSNPGRDPAYASSSGRDPDVVLFLEHAKGTMEFFDAARRLVDAQILEYQERGFTSLDVHFGCTGGQHRSVYFAERLAGHLRDDFPDVDVEVTHAEEARWGRPQDPSLTETRGPA